MQKLKMRDFSEELSKIPLSTDLVEIKDSTWLRAKYSGMYRSSVRTGAFIEKGNKIGSITDPFGEFEKINPDRSTMLEP